jgi:hypothetical protein
MLHWSNLNGKFYLHVSINKIMILFFSFQEIKEEAIDKSTAYMLFYEREGLSCDDYLPQIDSSRSTPDLKDLDDDLDDFKKQCVLM